jgi:hexulose-6-phosphate isomerase
MPQFSTNRRQFCQWGIAASTLAASGIGNGFAQADDVGKTSDKPWLRKTLKIGMVKLENAALEKKFELAREAGFEGIELNAPTIDATEANAAAKATGLIIDGTVGKYHWQTRHTDPAVATRAKAMELLKKGLENTAAVGGESLLLVPGHGKDGTDDQVYARAVDAVNEALPLAEKLKVAILIENVWNDFCYDHEGGPNQTADRLAKFIDEFDSPWVGMQFDIGNHWKYGDPAKWIRTLGKRIQKLDIKGFSRAKGGFTKITEGDINWPSVEKALHDIGFTGWLAAEVKGGDLTRLKEVSDHLEEALHCSKSLSRVG